MSAFDPKRTFRCTLTVVQTPPKYRFNTIRSAVPTREGDMRRREFIRLFSSIVAAWPLAARAQQADGARRIGVLLTRKADDPEGQKQFEALRRGLLELGWSEGKTIISKCAGRLPRLRRR